MTIPQRNSERTRKVVDVAAHLFASQGYHGTSTREIAELADISENTLFRYFDSKEALFWAVLSSRMAHFDLGGDLISGARFDGEPKDVLPLILAQMVDAVILNPGLLQLLAVAYIELRSKAEAVFAEKLFPSFSALNRYLAANIEKGKLRAIDSSLLTIALSSVLVYHELRRLIESAPPYSNRREAIRNFTAFWMNLLEPSSGEARDPEISKVAVKREQMATGLGSAELAVKESRH